MKIVVAGASGFLGRALISSLKGNDVVALVRDGKPVPGARHLTWNGLAMGNWAEEIDGADAVINFSGSPIAQKWSDENKRMMKESRVQSTYLIGQAIEGAERPPKVWINGSAVGYYGSRGAEILDEASSAGTGFMADLCRVWEDVLCQEKLPSTRRVALRTGLVLGKGGGVLKPLLTATKLFMGGRQGDGHHWMPWIHLDDYTAMILWLIENESIQGPVNACGIAPCLNETFMKTLRGVVGRPPAPPVPKAMLDLVGKIKGPDSEVVLTSTRVLPKVAQSNGFKWRHPSLEEALESVVKR